MGVTTTQTNKPFNPRGNDQSPLAFNRAKLYSGKALSFDGVNDEVDLGTQSFITSSGFSISTYLNIDDNSEHYIFSTGYSNADSLLFYSAASSTTFGVSWYDGSSATLSTAVDYTIGEWFHALITYDGTTLKIYKNGIEVVSEAFAIDNIASGVYEIGWASPRAKSTAYLQGKVGGFKTFNTALTAAQVADLYNNPEKVVPTGVDNTALKLWLPMQEGAGTTAYDGSPVGFTEDIVTGFTNGTTYPLDSFASSGDDITTAIKTNGFGGCVSNGHYYTNGQKVKVKFTYQKNSGNDLRVLFSSQVTGAGTAKSDIQNVSASGEFEHTFTMTADGIAYLQLGTGNAGHSIDAVITDVYVSPNVSANHGTISGATYTHGIGAPVSQTAVMNWNKGTNLLTRSEEFLDSDWIPQSSVTLTSGQDAPDGSTNAFKYNLSAATARAIDQTISFGIAPYTFAIYVKAIVDTTIRIRSYDGWSEEISINVADGWTRVDSSHAISASSTANIGFFDVSGSTGDRFYIWGASLEQSGSVGPYVRTGATAQTSEVLLPQGLTTGRDITGVNLFENVRKQGALNLDGNSWAEVHDNASLDMTSAISLEAWVYWDTAVDKGFVSKWNLSQNKASYLLYKASASRFMIYVSSDGSSILSQQNVTNISSGWNHLVGVYDGANLKCYLNGVLDGSRTYSSGLFSTDVPIEIGRYSESAVTAYADDIAQPRIYNRALTAEEVQRNYNAGKNTYTN